LFAYEKPKKEQAYKGAVQKKESEKTVTPPNVTGSSDAMKIRLEQASGFSFDDVQLYTNSDKQTHLQTHLQSLAYSKNTPVYASMGQEKQLPHESGHMEQKDNRLESASYGYNTESVGMINPNGLSGSVIQKMPWHSDKTFPRGLLTVPASDAVPGTAIPGYIFNGFTYQTRNRIIGNTSRDSLQASAEFISQLNLPSADTFLTNQVIATNPASKVMPAAGVAGNLGTTREAYDFINQLYVALEGERANGIAAVKLALTQVAGYLQKLGKNKRNAIRDSTTIEAIENELGSLVDTAKTTYKNNIVGGASSQYKNGMDPFLIKLDVGVTGNVAENKAFYYQFSRNSYGYIVKIEKGGSDYEMAVDGAGVASFENTIVANMTDRKFSSTHESTENNTLISDITVRDIDSLLGTDTDAQKRDKIRNNSKTMDSFTKILGEGARWQCVRSHFPNLTNDSRFYTIATANGRVHFITFTNLWKTWILFGKRFNIPNNDVSEKLITTAHSTDFQKGESADLTTFNATTNDYNLGAWIP